MARCPGLLDDDAAKLGSHLHNTRILVHRRAEKNGRRASRVIKAIIALPSANTRCAAASRKICAQARVQALTVPSYDDLISGGSDLGRIRQVELDDLLGRDPVVLDTRDCVTGSAARWSWSPAPAARSGSELCRQIARFHPARLVLFELSEYGAVSDRARPAGDVSDLQVVGLVATSRTRRGCAVIADRNPACSFHAAAYKTFR